MEIKYKILYLMESFCYLFKTFVVVQVLFVGVVTLQGTVVDNCNMCFHWHGKFRPSYLEPRQHCFGGSFRCRLVKG